MIRRVMKVCGIGLVLFCLVGCFQVDTLIKGKPGNTECEDAGG